jgi:hypothetical protein
MAPKRGTRRTSPSNNLFTQEDVARIVAEQIAASMPNIIAQVQADSGGAGGSGGGDDNIDGNGGGRSGRKGCSYKTFVSCKPMDFRGNEGAVGIIKWIERMESIIRISECKDESVVRYATCSFQDIALTWWNSEVQTRGWEAIDQMTWEELKTLMLKKFCPANEIQKMEVEFWSLEMKGADIMSYNDKFHEIARLVPHLVTPEAKRIQRYIWGLVPQIRSMITAARPATIREAMELAGS